MMGIDPGPVRSGVVWWDAATRHVLQADGAMDNAALLAELRDSSLGSGFFAHCDVLAIECIEAMYAHVGAATVQTILFTGRCMEAAESCAGLEVVALSPQAIKTAVCGTASAKDPAVRQALIDLLGAPGRKADPGPTYGVNKHAWRALAAVVAAENETERVRACEGVSGKASQPLNLSVNHGVRKD